MDFFTDILNWIIHRLPFPFNVLGVMFYFSFLVALITAPFGLICDYLEEYSRKGR